MVRSNLSGLTVCGKVERVESKVALQEILVDAMDFS